MVKSLKIKGVYYEICKNGYLINTNQWNQDFAKRIACKEKIKLIKPYSWLIIGYHRAFYIKYNAYLNTRKTALLLKKQFPNNGISSITVFKLFPDLTPQIAKIAGLPKPNIINELAQKIVQREFLNI